VSPLRQPLWVALLALIALRTTWMLAALWPFEVDDAWITLRYARHLSEGAGLTWNPGEPPVEGYSNFLFVLLGAGAMAVGLPPLAALKATGLAGLGAALAGLYRLGRRWLGPLGATAPVMALAAYPGAAVWAVSGMETLAFVGVAVGAALAFVRGVEGWERRWFAAAGGLVFVGALLRPEGPIIGAALAAGLWLAARSASHASHASHASRGSALSMALAFGAPYALYTAWRMWHFGQWLPNTVACKAAYDAHPHYLVFTMAAAFGWALLLGLWFVRQRRDGRALALVLPFVLYAVTLYRVDPVLGYWNRHGLAAIALVLVPGVAGGVLLCSRVFPRVSRAGWERAAALVGAVVLLVTAPSQATKFHTVAGEASAQAGDRADLADALAEQVGPEDSVLVGAAGVIAYPQQARVLDAFCLNDPDHPPLKGEPEAIAAHLMAQTPDVLVISSTAPDRLAPLEYLGVFPALVAHPDFEAHYALTQTHALGPDLAYFIYTRAR